MNHCINIHTAGSGKMHSNLSLFIQISNSSRHQVCVFLTGEGMKLTGMIFDNSIYVLIICIYDSLFALTE